MRRRYRCRLLAAAPWRLRAGDPAAPAFARSHGAPARIVKLCFGLVQKIVSQTPLGERKVRFAGGLAQSLAAVLVGFVQRAANDTARALPRPAFVRRRGRRRTNPPPALSALEHAAVLQQDDAGLAVANG